jgi:hypothetical protein
MADLVDRMGAPPQDRWQLFHDYYDVVYRREQERPIPAAELLRYHRADIDEIHSRVALLLQAEGERAGSTEARLPADRFAAVVAGRLEEQGFRGEKLERLRTQVIEAAAQRLVFLVGLEQGLLGFEIRSLQEYMVGEALMTGPELEVQDRLRHFAAIASWRNVFLFAAGRCFVYPQQQHLRDTIVAICQELNDDLAGPMGRAILAGSSLALELLEDGVARRQPRYERDLATLAARLLELPAGEIHGWLAGASEGELEKVLREKIAEAVEAPQPTSLSGWATLLPIVGKGISWALNLATARWPTDLKEQLAALEVPTVERAGAWLRPRLETAILASSPSSPIARQLGELARELDLGLPEAVQFVYEQEWSHPGMTAVATPLPGLESYFWSIEAAREAVAGLDLDLGGCHPGWTVVLEGLRFAGEPSKKRLADSLRRVAASPEAFQARFWARGPIPWVYSACVRSSRSLAEISELADKGDRGELGDLSEWLAAERRWRDQGASIQDSPP